MALDERRVTLKSASPDREDGRRRPAGRRRPRPRRRASSGRASRPLELDAHRRGDDPRRAAASRRSSACPAAWRRTGTRCASRIDDEVVHGIPGKRRIREGQIVSIDAGAIVDGWHGDAARSFIVGEVPDRDAHAGRGHARRRCTRASPPPAGQPPGRHLGAPSRTSPWRTATASCARSSATASAPRCTRSRRSPTTAPASRGRRSSPGLCLAIEPMFTLGSHEVRVKPDGWTVETRDGSLAAHWEHTIAVTADGPAHPDRQQRRADVERHRPAGADGACRHRAPERTCCPRELRSGTLPFVRRAPPGAVCAMRAARRPPDARRPPLIHQ